MTDKLKCPFCNADLIVHTDEQMAVCRNPNCKYDGWHFPVEIIQRMIDGKKARDALNYAIGVLDNLTEIGGVDMEIIKIKKMAGIKYV